MPLLPSRAPSATNRGDLTNLSIIDATILVCLISVGIWTLIGLTIFGT